LKLLIQRVTQASVETNGGTIGAIRRGALVLLGIHREDHIDQVVPLLEKLIHLRIFSDTDGKMNLSLLDTSGELLVVSQFTLYANCKSGRRPSFIESAPPEHAQTLYTHFVEEAKKRLPKVETGEFGAMMQVSLINDGPVTLILEDRCC
jgi:D-aminoacyl-tRNA deacylase